MAETCPPGTLNTLEIAGPLQHAHLMPETPCEPSSHDFCQQACIRKTIQHGGGAWESRLEKGKN